MSHRVKVIIRTLVVIMCLMAFFGFAEYTRRRCDNIYNEGVSLLKSGKYTEAVDCFKGIGDYANYRDISKLLEEHGFSVCPHCGKLIE